MTEKRVAFLFGAGASAGSGPCTPSAPPLGRDLRTRMIEEAFWPKDLPDDVLCEFDLEFERGMEALYRRYTSREYNSLTRAMARYFSRFLPARGNRYFQLFQRLPTGHLYSIGSLNYENLIEHAVASLGMDATMVRKLHGSCSYLPKVGNGEIRRIVAKSADWAFDIRANVEIVIDPAAIEEWFLRHPDNSFSPAMSFYAPLKLTKISPGFIANQRAKWTEEIGTCDLCFVIGVACNPSDEHIWNALRQTPGQLIYVSPFGSGFATWALERASPTEHWTESFRHAIPKIILRCKA